MAMDPERPIEKALRACAARRRRAAGEPFGLHPATRRLLQGEVARQYGRPAAGTWRWTDWLARIWPRVIWATGAAVVVLGAVWLLAPAGSKTQQMQLAKNLDVPRAAPAEAEAPAPTPGVALAPSVAPPATATADKPLLLAKRDTADHSVQPAGELDNSLALAQSEKPAPALETAQAQATIKESLAAMSQVEQKAASAPPPAAVAAAPPQESGLTSYGPARAAREANLSAVVPSTPNSNLALVLSSPPSLAEDRLLFKNEPSADAKDAAFFLRQESSAALGGLVQTNRNAALVAADSFQKQKAPPTVQRFARANATSAIADATAPAGAVLTAFQMEQSGLSLRVVDRDGSIYTGYLEIADNQPASIAATTPAAAQARSFSPAPTRAQSSSSTARRLQPLPQLQYAFRVTGTNQTLNQQVVFTGNFRNQTNLPSAPSTLRAKVAAQSTSPLMNSQISGKVFIGDRPPVEILATPAPQ